MNKKNSKYKLGVRFSIHDNFSLPTFVKLIIQKLKTYCTEYSNTMVEMIQMFDVLWAKSRHLEIIDFLKGKMEEELKVADIV